jgi:hypothetical protein
VIAYDHGTVPNPTVTTDKDFASARNTLCVNRFFDVGILVIVVHNQDGGSKQNIGLKNDLVACRNRRSSTDTAATAKNDPGFSTINLRRDV